MREYLVSEIAKREGELELAAQRIQNLETELRILRDVLMQHDREEREASASTNSRRESREPRSDQRRKRSRVGPRWRPVIKAAVERYPDFLKNEDVREIQMQANQEPGSPNEIRSHVFTYVRDGLYERGASGAFRATAKAAQAVEIPLGGESSSADSNSPQGEPGFGQPRLGLNDLESVEAVEAARKAGGT
jgi:hypothetical protein